MSSKGIPYHSPLVCFKQFIKVTAASAASLSYREPSAINFVGLYRFNFRSFAASSLKIEQEKRNLRDEVPLVNGFL
jgi:hypothetical protein